MNNLTCDMVAGCTAEVTHIDADGFVYCQGHGLVRKQYCRCRKLTKVEITKLSAGQCISYVKRNGA